MSTHLTRKELKQDNVALKVGEAAGYVSSHKSQTVRYAAIILGVIVIAGLAWFFVNSRREARQMALGAALGLESATVGDAPAGASPHFATEAAKTEAVAKALTSVTAQYSGSDEAHLANYYLAARKVSEGKQDEAMRLYQDVAANSSAEYASLAKLAMADLEFSAGHADNARKLLQELIDKPTAMVSKEQATVSLAKGIAATQPEEARKLLTPLASSTQPEISQIAGSALADLPPQK